MNGITEIAESLSSELKRRLPKQRKTQRTKLALLVATMLDVRSANLMDLAAGLPREADRTGPSDPMGRAQAGTLLRRDQRFDQRPLGIRHITRIPEPLSLVKLAIALGPHNCILRHGPIRES